MRRASRWRTSQTHTSSTWRAPFDSASYFACACSSTKADRARGGIEIAYQRERGNTIQSITVRAFAHIRASPSCRGYTTWSSGREGCGCCGWGMSARLCDIGTISSARFAQAAIARVGQAIALAVDELVQALFEAVLPC